MWFLIKLTVLFLNVLLIIHMGYVTISSAHKLTVFVPIGYFLWLILRLD